MSDRQAEPAVRPERRGAAQIEADLAATRERLATTIDAIVDRVHPKALASRGASSARSLVVDDAGGPRLVRLGLAVAVAGGAVVLFVLAARRTRRR